MLRPFSFITYIIQKMLHILISLHHIEMIFIIRLMAKITNSNNTANLHVADKH
jgi:hypothetical protein